MIEISVTTHWQINTEIWCQTKKIDTFCILSLNFIDNSVTIMEKNSSRNLLFISEKNLPVNIYKYIPTISNSLKHIQNI